MKEVIVIIVGGFAFLIAWTLYACLKISSRADLQMLGQEAYRSEPFITKEATEDSENTVEEATEDAGSEAE